jgi:DNA-binding NarL/FixJ family response regulator
MTLKLIIADDHPLLVDGLRRVLEEIEGVQLLEPVSNGWQLLDRLRKDPGVDLVLLDLHMPKLDGVETLKILRRDYPRLKVLVFTNYHTPKLIKEIKQQGAQGYLLKDSNASTLKEAVTTVAAGGTWVIEAEVEQEAPAHFVDDFIKKYQVTKREVEIIRRIAEGMTSKEISEHLCVSEFTINAHRRNICRKLNIYTPVGLLNFAQEHGLV